MSLDLTPGINHGALVEVVEAEGTGLVGDHAIGATVLTVAAGGFRNAGQCRVAGNVYAYVREGDSLAITPPLVAAADDGTPVESLAPNGDVETRLLAIIDLDMLGEENESTDEAEDLPRAWIPGEVTGYYPIGTSAAGSIVNVRDTAYGYQVVGRPTDAPSLDQSAINAPSIALYQAANVNWLSGVGYAPLTDWTVAEQFGMGFDAVNGKVICEQPGRYLALCTSVWAGNTTGTRGLQAVTTLLGTDSILHTDTGSPPDATNFTQHFAADDWLVPGQAIRLDAYQSSTALLAMRGAASGRLTKFHVFRIQA